MTAAGSDPALSCTRVTASTLTGGGGGEMDATGYAQCGGLVKGGEGLGAIATPHLGARFADLRTLNDLQNGINATEVKQGAVDRMRFILGGVSGRRITTECRERFARGEVVMGRERVTV
ncbi:hypothetical protein B0H17DRAFT_1148392 [Mycena rosella]|uniref:Uncharacterized protein n=1 Tax=Mycena rosella TaxID=1033263 RepID=A0AAD7FY58_MYCRO|nr:hypothetical protein B0H17DRAFT_1148392 [Mycena rosella]